MDTWAPEQVVSLQQMGNSRARAVYEALLSDNFRRPQTDSGLESFIRAKYEQKKYIAREWIQPPPITKVDWDKEIEEEIENQKRKKKSTSTTATISEPSKLSPSPANISIPAPLPKPSSPKTPRFEMKKAATSVNSMDLLGLDTSTPSVILAASPVPACVPKAATLIGDSFDFFANVSSKSDIATVPQKNNETVMSNSHVTSLKQEEDDFFNQKNIDNGAEKAKMTKDNILALYGNAPSYTPPQVHSFNSNLQKYAGVAQDQNFAFGQQTGAPGAQLFKPNIQPQQPQNFALPQPMMYHNGNFGNFNANFGTMQTQQINKLNEENIKKIESLNFSNFK